MENSAAASLIPEERWYCAECGAAVPEGSHIQQHARGRLLTWCSPQCLTIMADRCSGELVSVRGAHGPRVVP